MLERYQLHAAPVREDDQRACRSISRQPVYMVAAFVLPGGSSAPIACTVRDISGAGARLELDRERLRSVAPAVELPEQFTLYFCPDHTEVKCRLAWRDGRHFGVAFLEAPHPSDKRLS